MQYQIKLLDWEAVQKDTLVTDLTVVQTCNTVPEVLQWAKDKGYKLVRDTSLFGGYFRNYDGTAWLVDFKPDANDLVAPTPEYPRTFTVEGLIATLKTRNPKALVYMGFPYQDNLPFTTFHVQEVCDDKLTDGENDTPVVILQASKV